MIHDRLQRLLDLEEIRDLTCEYARCVDLLDAEGVARLFTDDCVVDYGPGMGTVTEGSAELGRRLATGLPRFEATSHHISNVQVRVDEADPDRATGIAYLYAWHRLPGDAPDAHLWGQYHDVFRRTADGWRIAERTLKVAGQEAFDVPWHPIGRGPSGRERGVGSP